MSEADSGAKEQTALICDRILFRDMEARKAEGYPEPKTQDTVYSYLDSAFSSGMADQGSELRQRNEVVREVMEFLETPKDTVAKLSSVAKLISERHRAEYNATVAPSNLNEDVDVLTSIEGLEESQH